jgi:hypothetical protein
MRMEKSNEDLVEEFLVKAEKLFGPRFRGVRFKVQESPRGQLHSEFDPSTNHVTILLPKGLNENDRKGQLAQESIHVLSPATPNEAKVFDRGLATFFVVNVLGYPRPDRNQQDYLNALEAVERLNEKCPDAIRTLRSAQQRVALISADEIIKVCPDFPESDARFLVQPIY